MNSKAVFAIFMVYAGCGLNNVFMEYLIRSDPGSGHLITFSQFLFVAVYCFFFYSRCGKVPRIVPMKDYVILVSLFFVTSVLNNWAFSFHIPVPLHMIFRSGSLIANMIMGIIILKKRYTFSKVLSVAMITIGIITCTLITGSSKAKACTDCNDNIPSTQGSSNLFWWSIGIIVLTTALLLSARMGIYQEYLYKEHGKHPNEALYYAHLLSLPGFLFYSKDIIEHFGIVTASDLYTLPVLYLEIPILCLYLIGNVITQYMCISSVYVLTTECSSLTVTLVITLRKFMSLIISIVYFQNPFTLGHWIGTGMVFVGTLIFTEVTHKIVNIFNAKDTKVKMS